MTKRFLSLGEFELPEWWVGRGNLSCGGTGKSSKLFKVLANDSNKNFGVGRIP